MRLVRLRLHGFRRYAADTPVELRPGLNVFCGANEAGKSTLVQAIQYALYVPRTEVERLACVAEGQDQCRIWLEYELDDGARYCLERDLVAHRHALSRWDGRAWNQVSTQLTDISRAVQAHTGCDQLFFERSLLVRHETIEVPSTDDLTAAVAARLELLIGGQSKVSAVKAVAKLEKRLGALTGPRAGEIAIAESRLQEAKRHLASDQQGQLDLISNRAELVDLEERIKDLEEESRTTSAVLERHQRLQDIDRAQAETRARRDAIDKALDAREKAKQLDSELRKLEAQRPTPLVAATGSRWWLTELAVGALLVAAAVAAAVTRAVRWHLVIGLFAIPGLLLIRLGWRGRPRAVAPDEATIEFEARRRELEQQFAAAKAVAAMLSTLDDAQLKSERAKLSRDLEELEIRVREEAASRLSPEEVERRRARVDVLGGELPGARERRAVLLSRLQDAERSAGVIAELEDQVGELERRLKSLRVRAEATALAHDELQAALEEVRNAAGPRIVEAATRHLQAVIPSYAVTLAADKGLTFLPVWADGRPFGRRALSDGTADQFYFAVRVALAEQLLRDQRPPLILDDPFQYCDPSRRAALHGLLRKLAKERQVLYFTIDQPADLEVTHPL